MVEHYNHPPEGPEDISPADDVFRVGDEVVIDHGPGDQTRIGADEFYDDDSTPDNGGDDELESSE
jgi:hypothetical protein